MTAQPEPEYTDLTARARAAEERTDELQDLVEVYAAWYMLFGLTVTLLVIYAIRNLSPNLNIVIPAEAVWTILSAFLLFRFEPQTVVHRRAEKTHPSAEGAHEC